MLRTMRIGQTGPDILATQQGLNIHSKGARIAEDGIFGPKTQRAVQEFQQTNLLAVDGVVGPITRSVLFPLVATTINIFAARSGSEQSGFRARTAGLVIPGIPQPTPTFALAPLKPPGLLQPVQAPVPATPTAPRLKLDSFQLAPGGQVSFAGLLADPQPSLALTLQSVFKRGEDDGRLELALGVQVGSPIFVLGSDGVQWAFSWFANFTWVDPLGKLGLFHFWAPFATVGGQADGKSREASLGTGLFPINLSLDIIPDKLNISANSGLAGTFSLRSKEFQWGFQSTIGVNGTFTIF